MDTGRWEELQQRDRRAEALGVDVAWGGRDKTCWTVIDRFGIIEQIVLDLKNTMEIPGLTIKLMQRYVDAGVSTFDLKYLPLTMESTTSQMRLLAGEVLAGLQA